MLTVDNNKLKNRAIKYILSHEELSKEFKKLYPNGDISKLEHKLLTDIAEGDVSLASDRVRKSLGYEKTNYYLVLKKYPSLVKWYGKSVDDLEEKELERLANGEHIAKVLGLPTEPNNSKVFERMIDELKKLKISEEYPLLKKWYGVDINELSDVQFERLSSGQHITEVLGYPNDLQIRYQMEEELNVKRNQRKKGYQNSKGNIKLIKSYNARKSPKLTE